jgi:hypothetical protein
VIAKTKLIAVSKYETRKIVRELNSRRDGSSGIAFDYTYKDVQKAMKRLLDVLCSGVALDSQDGFYYTLPTGSKNLRCQDGSILEGFSLYAQCNKYVWSHETMLDVIEDMFAMEYINSVSETIENLRCDGFVL